MIAILTLLVQVDSPSVQSLTGSAKFLPRRRFPSVSGDVHGHLLYILEGNHVATKDRSSAIRKAYYYHYTYRDRLSVCEVENPVTKIKESRILFKNEQDSCVIVLRTEEKQECIAFFYDRAKGESARKIKTRIDVVFTGISEDEIQRYINSSRLNQKIKGTFDNKPPLHPVRSGSAWNQFQIDLMSMADKPADVEGKQFKWILSCIDVFSRYLILRPLCSKEAATVAEELLQIFADLGTPVRIQCDRGSEFRGSVNKVAKKLNVKIIRSSARHPQSQGKVCAYAYTHAVLNNADCWLLVAIIYCESFLALCM